MVASNLTRNIFKACCSELLAKGKTARLRVVDPVRSNKNPIERPFRFRSPEELSLVNRLSSWRNEGELNDEEGFLKRSHIQEWMMENSVDDLDEITASNLVSLVKYEFRRDSNKGLDYLIKGFQALQEYMITASCTSVSESNGIKVEISTRHSKTLKQINNNEDEQIYLFDYRVRLTNLSSAKVNLIGRHWKLSSNGELMEFFTFINLAKTEDVVPKYAYTVVGETPTLKDSSTIFEYMSCASLRKPLGEMNGAFLCVNLVTKDSFEVKLQPTRLQASHDGSAEGSIDD